MTGGAGFIGSNIVRRLVELNARMAVLDDLFTGAPSNLVKNTTGGSALHPSIEPHRFRT